MSDDLTEAPEPFQQTRVTVGVLNYNYAHFIDRCLTSILAQKGTEFDVVVVNDASTDDSLDRIAPYLDDQRVHLIDHSDNRGFCSSLIEASTFGDNEFLMVVSADDWLAFDGALAAMVDALDAEAAVAMAFGSYGHYYDPQHCAHRSRFGAGSWVRDGLDAFELFVNEGIPLHSGTLIRRQSYIAVGGYDGSLRYALDVQIFYLLCQVGKVAYIDRELVAWRRHATSMTKDLRGVELTIREVLEIIDRAVSMMDDADSDRVALLRRRARQRALTMFASDAVFNDQRRLAWRLYRIGFRVSPLESLFQRSVPAMLARATLGASCSSRLQSRLNRNRDPSCRTPAQHGTSSAEAEP